MKREKYFFVFDVESVGLHGEGFAVAGGVYLSNGAVQYSFSYACPVEAAEGSEENRKWVRENIPVLEITHRCPFALRLAFWEQWQLAKAKYPDIYMAADVAWPVEANFLSQCVQDATGREWEGPYPLIDIASVRFAAGFHPTAAELRTESEKPAHHPLTDARQSARLLVEAMHKIRDGFII